MKIKTFIQTFDESPDFFDSKVNDFMAEVNTLDVLVVSGAEGKPESLANKMTIIIIYTDKNYYNSSLVSKEY